MSTSSMGECGIIKTKISKMLNVAITVVDNKAY